MNISGTVARRKRNGGTRGAERWHGGSGTVARRKRNGGTRGAECARGNGMGRRGERSECGTPQIKRAAAHAAALINQSNNKSQHYINVINIQPGERPRNDGRTLRAEVVGVEDDIVAVAVFKPLLRLECLAENVGGNKRTTKRPNNLTEICIKVNAVVFLANIDINITLVVKHVVLFLAEVQCAAEICVAVDPDGELVEVGCCDLHHVGCLVV